MIKIKFDAERFEDNRRGKSTDNYIRVEGEWRVIHIIDDEYMYRMHNEWRLLPGSVIKKYRDAGNWQSTRYKGRTYI
jgi:hypothetical protein